MSAFRSYILCTSPRSGSTLLCKMLAQTGVAGAPDSHFHAPSLAAWLGYYDLQDARFASHTDALAAIVKAAIARGRGQGDVFGLRMQRHSFGFFTDQLRQLYPDAPTDRARIEAAFGPTLFIHLTREDKLDQAISFVRATQSGLWHRAADGTELERSSSPQEPVYDRAAIAEKRDASVQMDAEWLAWFASQDITPLRLTYDALSQAPYKALDRVLAALNLSWTAPPGATPPVAKLSDAINRDWAARFRAEEAD